MKIGSSGLETLLTQGKIVLLAVMCGISIGSAYYAQPLLPTIGQVLGISQAALGMVPMLTQIGIGVGVLLFMPLGDVVDNRKLILYLVGIHVGTLMLVASSSSASMLNWSSAALGLTTVTPYLLPPFAARLAPVETRGHVTGLLARGVFAGILLARTVSAYVNYLSGWNTIYWIAACAMLVIGFLFAREIPSVPPTLKMEYGDLLKSLVTVFRNEPKLRLAALTQGALFGAFSAFWTVLAFQLNSPSFHVPSYVSGLFGIIGLAGAAAAPVFGKLADRRSPQTAVLVGVTVTLISWIVFGLFGHSLAGLIVGVLLLDLGTTASHVSNQTIIYHLGHEHRSRTTTIYILGLFIGGALLSRLSTVVWSDWGWSGVCVLGFSATFIAFLGNVLRALRSGENNRVLQADPPPAVAVEAVEPARWNLSMRAPE